MYQGGATLYAYNQTNQRAPELCMIKLYNVLL